MINNLLIESECRTGRYQTDIFQQSRKFESRGIAELQLECIIGIYNRKLTNKKNNKVRGGATVLKYCILWSPISAVSSATTLGNVKF